MLHNIRIFNLGISIELKLGNFKKQINASKVPQSHLRWDTGENIVSSKKNTHITFNFLF